VPVKIITGTVRIGITANHRAIIRSFGADVTVIPGATHFIRRDARDAFHDLVDQFLDIACPA
jgi:pimeloyl-ACP methyl ester carboxylesterase